MLWLERDGSTYFVPVAISIVRQTPSDGGGPFAQQGPGIDVGEHQPPEHHSEGARDIGAAILRHDALAGDAAPTEPRGL